MQLLCLGLLKEEVYFIKPMTSKKFEGQLQEVISAIPQKFLGRSVDVIPEQLGKFRVKANAHTKV